MKRKNQSNIKINNINYREVQEIEEAKITTQVIPKAFGNQLIPLEQLEKNVGAFQLNDENEKESIPNLTLLTSAVKPFNQVLEIDEEWNYDFLHAEIGQIVRTQYGEFYQK